MRLSTICPHCGSNNNIDVSGCDNGTNLAVCKQCHNGYNFILDKENNKASAWLPPKISGVVYRGAGIPGGKD